MDEICSDAAVVGLGWTARTVRELHIAALGCIEVAVESHGFRSVLIEGDLDASEALDRFVRQGVGDPLAILASSRPFLASEELADIVMWLRRRNEQHPDDVVRLVSGGVDDISSPMAIERSLDAQIADWYERFGAIVYLGGVAHVADAGRRMLAFSSDEPVASAGTLLRRRFGSGYRAVGLTFGRGEIPAPVPEPPSHSVEAFFDRQQAHPTAFLRLDGDGDGDYAIRVVGPNYDPAEDADHVMVGNPSEWFDRYLHHKVGTATSPLPH